MPRGPGRASLGPGGAAFDGWARIEETLQPGPSGRARAGVFRLLHAVRRRMKALHPELHAAIMRRAPVRREG